MNKLIPLDAAIAALDSHAHGKTTLGGQTYRSITLGVAVEALQAIPTIDPAAIREAALRDAAGLIANMSRIITHTDEDIGTLTGRNLIDPRKAAAAILALIGEKK